MMNVIKDNRGLTLLELIVSFALLTIVSAAVLGLMTTGANSYSRVNTEVSLQYESQLTMNQLREYLVDSNAGICWDDTANALYVANRTVSTVTVHRFRKSDDQILYSTGTVTRSGPTGACDYSTEYLLSSYVDSFTVDRKTSNSPTGKRLCDSCTIELNLKLGSRAYTVSDTVAMRNPVLTLTDYQGWLNLLANGS